MAHKLTMKTKYGALADIIRSTNKMSPPVGGDIVFVDTILLFYGKTPKKLH